MTTACSACRTILPPGVVVCPNCRLQLTAQAVPVVTRRKPLLDPLQWLVLAVAVFVGIWALANLQSNHDAKVDAATAQARAGKLAQEAAIVSSVNTPESFAAKCGQPAKRYQRLLGEDRLDPSDPANPTTLVYRDASSEMHVAFYGKTPAAPVFREHVAGHLYEVRPYEGLMDIGCVKPESR